MDLRLTTTPYFPLIVQSCSDLSLTNWTTVATDTPITNLWAMMDGTSQAGVTQRFYRASLSY